MGRIAEALKRAQQEREHRLRTRDAGRVTGQDEDFSRNGSRGTQHDYLEKV